MKQQRVYISIYIYIYMCIYIYIYIYMRRVWGRWLPQLQNHVCIQGYACLDQGSAAAVIWLQPSCLLILVRHPQVDEGSPVCRVYVPALAMFTVLRYFFCLWVPEIWFRLFWLDHHVLSQGDLVMVILQVSGLFPLVIIWFARVGDVRWIATLLLALLALTVCSASWFWS